MDVILDTIGQVAEISRHGQFDTRCAQGEADGIDGVVGDRERLDREVADLESGAGLEFLDGWRWSAGPIDGLGGQMGEEDGLAALELAGQDRQPRDVVGVFVGDKDGVEVIGVLADGRQA